MALGWTPSKWGENSNSDSHGPRTKCTLVGNNAAISSNSLCFSDLKRPVVQNFSPLFWTLTHFPIRYVLLCQYMSASFAPLISYCRWVALLCYMSLSCVIMLIHAPLWIPIGVSSSQPPWCENHPMWSSIHLVKVFRQNIWFVDPAACVNIWPHDRPKIILTARNFKHFQSFHNLDPTCRDWFATKTADFSVILAQDVLLLRKVDPKWNFGHPFIKTKISKQSIIPQ